MELHDTSEVLHRIRTLERRLGDQETALNEATAKIQQQEETGTTVPLVTTDNQLQNGDFDTSRNDFLYYYDVTATEGDDGDVSEELYGWFTSEPDTSITAFGATDIGDPSLFVLDTPDFVVGDVGLDIVVEGAGTSGADFMTTIFSFVNTSSVYLTETPPTLVENARARWRLLTLVEDSTDEDADADQATNTTVKNADHTLYATTISDPDWDKENGYVRLGSTNWLCQPLALNLIWPSLQYISSFIYRLAAPIDDEAETRIKFFIGIWDNTAGQQCFLESDPIEVTAEVIGSPTLTTSTDYFLVFTTNWGMTIGSEIVTVAAPTTYSNGEYVGLSWIQPAGVIRTDIYRKRGATVRLLNPPYPQSSYRDKGATRGDVLSAFPAVDTTRSVAYMETTDFNLALASTETWRSVQVNLPIPKTYDLARTTDKQWFVMGLVEAAGDDRAILIDRVVLEDKPFGRAARDAAARRNLSSQPHGADIGGYGGAGDIGPGDTDYCPVFETPIEVERLNGTRTRIPAIELVDNEDIYRIVNLDGEPDEYEAAISPQPQVCYELKAGQYALQASQSHPVFTNDRGEYKLLLDLTDSDIVLGRAGLVKVDSNIRLIKQRHTVKISLKGKQKGFWAAGIGSHNRKADVGEIA